MAVTYVKKSKFVVTVQTVLAPVTTVVVTVQTVVVTVTIL